MTIITNELLQTLTERVDQAVDAMMDKINSQRTEIDNLKIENSELKALYAKTLEQINEYIAELEKIKNHYVNSNNNIKQ